jgi:hypothetical protein
VHLAVRSLGVLVSLVILGSVAYGIHARNTRTPADFICRWKETGPTHGEFLKLVRKEPASLADYREILRRGSSAYIDAEVAKRVALIGDPEIDLPLLKEARGRLETKNGSSSSYVETIDEAISALKRW